MKKWLIPILFISISFLAACGIAEGTEDAKVASKDIEQLVHEYSTGDFDDVQASITSTELIVTDEDGEEERVALPEDKFFLSIAPYITETHPCVDHSLTGCQGEMTNEAVTIAITDSEGNIILDEVTETMENGFIDLWLPRNEEYKVSVSYKGDLKAETTLSTFEDDQTCITTMQLEEI
jgi:hypothetical protein